MVGASLLVVQLLIDRLGFEAYGVWVLVQTVVLYVTTAELGVGPAVARFTSLHVDHPHRPRQILSAALVLYVMVGLLVVLACHLLGGPFADAFSVPAALRDDAVATVHLIGWVTLAALVAGVMGHALTGFERFAAFTWSNAAGSILFLITLVVLLRDDPRLQDVAVAALLQWLVVAGLRVIALRGVLLSRGSRRPSREIIREMFGFSVRLQAAVASNLLNTQTDRLVIGAVAPAVTVGHAGVATQVADAGRFLGYAVFSPVMSRMAVTYGDAGREALDALYSRQRRTWIVGLLGALAVAIGAVHPGITAWLGAGVGDAPLFAVLLIAGYGIGLLPNPAFGYLRAIGSPGLEGRYGIITVVVNVAATIVLGVLFGARGVVAATALAYLLSTAWVIRRALPLVPASREAPIPKVRVLCAMALAGGAVALAGQALVDALPRPVALAGVLLVSAAAFGAYLAATTGFRPGALLRAVRH